MQALVGIVMGSASDAAIMDAAKAILAEFGVPYEYTIVSAHRTPDRLWAYGKSAVNRGLKVLIAAAGGAAHLPGMLASLTPLPVIGVPIRSSQSMAGLDSLLSIVQMPKGVPVATVAVDNAVNAALLAIRILAVSDRALLLRMQGYQERLREEALRPLLDEPERFHGVSL
ncbi:MAG: 5-(carboxyamino)imidazole ribonucleotide mutase [Bacteroidia bacterium]|nr:5-(carboxyamino)imidazole ribonucleotide mutase [Bacteroidia bacterium]